MNMKPLYFALLAIVLVLCATAKDTNRVVFRFGKYVPTAEDVAYQRGLRDGANLTARFFTNDFTRLAFTIEEGVWISYRYPDSVDLQYVLKRDAQKYWPEPRTNFCVSVKIDSDGELTITKLP